MIRKVECILRLSRWESLIITVIYHYSNHTSVSSNNSLIGKVQVKWKIASLMFTYFISIQIKHLFTHSGFKVN